MYADKHNIVAFNVFNGPLLQVISILNFNVTVLLELLNYCYIGPCYH